MTKKKQIHITRNKVDEYVELSINMKGILLNQKVFFCICIFLSFYVFFKIHI